MNLLFVTARFPFPPHKGDQAIPYYRLKYLSETHEITLITVYQRDEELEALGHVSPFCRNVIPVKIGKWRSLANMLGLGLFSSLPLQVLYYRSGALAKAVREELTRSDYHYDLLHVYMLRIAECGTDEALPPVPRVLELIDSMQLNFERRAREEKFPAKLLFNLELKRLRAYENKMAALYHRCIVVSDKDRQHIGLDNVETIPLGIDTRQFCPRDGDYATVSAEPVIVFTGNMGYFPNRNAILWFLEHCWDRIKAEVPAVRLRIAGKGPGNAIKCFHDGRTVEVLGYVNPMADILRSARLAIAPMQSGSGMQFKILEAMACGVPVVTTQLGLGTIPAQPDHDILVGNTPKEFAGHCIRLLTHRNSAERIGKKGFRLIHQSFGWEQNITRLETIYQKIKTSNPQSPN